MKEKIPKIKFLFGEESEEEDFVEETREEIEDEEDLSSVEDRAKEEIRMKRLMRRIERSEKKQAKVSHKEEVKDILLKVLSKGKVVSKYGLTKLLIQYGVKNYSYRLNLIENTIRYEIPNIGNILKSLRFQKKIFFSMEKGSHVFYMNKDQKVIKPKEKKYFFNDKSYRIPEGESEIYLIFKIPGTDISTRHFLTSCYPNAEFKGFNLTVKSNYERTGEFYIFQDQLDGYITSDRLILRCKTTDTTLAQTLYKIIKIGRKIIKELIYLNLKESEILKVLNKRDRLFIPVVPIFRSSRTGVFYDTKYTNAIRILYDFPQKIESQDIYGKYSMIIKRNREDGRLDLKKYNDFINRSFEFLVKSFISTAIWQDWIINPRKAYNYMKSDEDLDCLIEEYIQDIDTDRILREKLESSMEKTEFLRDITTNLLLTLLGLSILTQEPIFQWIIIGAFVIINLYFLFTKSRRSKKIYQT